MRVSDFPQNTQRHLANNKNPVSEQHKMPRVCGMRLFPDVVSQSVGTHKGPRSAAPQKMQVIPNLACIRDSPSRLQN